MQHRPHKITALFLLLKETNKPVRMPSVFGFLSLFNAHFLISFSYYYYFGFVCKYILQASVFNFCQVVPCGSDHHYLMTITVITI